MSSLTSAGGDWVITIVLVDPTSPGHERKLEGTAVTLFRAKDTELPIVYPGMVVALRGVKVRRLDSGQNRADGSAHSTRRRSRETCTS